MHIRYIVIMSIHDSKTDLDTEKSENTVEGEPTDVFREEDTQRIKMLSLVARNALDKWSKVRKKYASKPVMYWNEEEVKRILSVLKTKIYIATGMGYFCALRIHEVKQSKVEDLDFKKMKVWTVGKGGFRSHVPMLKDGMPFWVDLKKWTEGQPPTSPVIPGRSKDGTVSTEYIERQFKKTIRELNLTWGEKGHFHLLRHSRLTMLKAKTGNMTFVKQFARHSKNTDTERIYTHAPVDDLGKKIDRFL